MFNQVVETIKNTEEKPLNTSNWMEFSIDSLFELKRGQRLRSVDRKDGNIRYFSATSDNNGVSCFISNPLFIEENALIFNTFGNVFYSDKIFTGSDEITILKHEKLNKRIGLFLSTTMSNQLEYKFGFGKKAFYNEVRKEKIKLPSKYNEETSEIEPDWDYMESYIKDLEKELKMF
jgi:type I restriction enzyme M protein